MKIQLNLINPLMIPQMTVMMQGPIRKKLIISLCDNNLNNSMAFYLQGYLQIKNIIIKDQDRF